MGSRVLSYVRKKKKGVASFIALERLLIAAADDDIVLRLNGTPWRKKMTITF